MSRRRDDVAESRSVGDQGAHYHVIVGRQQFLVVRHSHVWRPPTDVVEEDNRLTVFVEIAGMQHGEFQVAIGARHLSISGVRPALSMTYTAYHQLEIRYGEFRTDVALPWPVDEDGIVARYEDGFLRVDLPRALPERVKVISVDKPSSTSE